MPTPLLLHLNSLADTQIAAQSLKETLYTFPLTVFCRGPLGAGKTTFIQSFAKSLGIEELPTSPTYALEQRYQLPNGGTFLHADLYRLSPAQASALIEQSESDAQIRCIEWAERLDKQIDAQPGIHLTFEERETRELTVDFRDMPLPSRAQIEDWRKEVALPEHIARHCDSVAEVTRQLSLHETEHHRIVRSEALERGAEVHDLLRYIDFDLSALPGNDEERRIRETWKAKYADLRHEAACAEFLREQGFPELSTIVRTHGLSVARAERQTIEQRLLYYADKRVAHERFVTLDERFQEFADRYNNGVMAERHVGWLKEAREIEAELFPEGAPELNVKIIFCLSH